MDVPSMLNPRPPPSLSLIDSLTELGSLQKWRASLDPIAPGLADYVLSSIEVCLNAVKHLSQVGNGSFVERGSREEFGEAQRRTMALVQLLSTWTPLSSPAPAQQIIELIDELGQAIGELGWTVNVDKLSLPLTWEQFQNRPPREAAIEHEVKELNKLSVEAEEVFNLARSEMLKLWEAPAGERMTAEGYLTRVGQSIKELKRITEENIREHRIQLRPENFDDALSKRKLAMQEVAEVCAQPSTFFLNRSTGTQKMSAGSARLLKQKFNKITEAIKSVASVLGIFEDYDVVIQLPNKLQEKPTRAAAQANVAKAMDAHFGRWGEMSARRANIYGLL